MCLLRGFCLVNSVVCAFDRLFAFIIVSFWTLLCLTLVFCVLYMVVCLVLLFWCCYVCGLGFACIGVWIGFMLFCLFVSWELDVW